MSAQAKRSEANRSPRSSGAQAPRDDSPLSRLQAYLADTNLGAGRRLPPERELCTEIGVTRAQLRGALAKLEADGLVWRHVGKGTFVGLRPLDNLADISAMTRRTNPVEIMKTRMLLEPEVAGVAALNATFGDLIEMRTCLQHTRNAQSKREYDAWDSRLHRTIATSTHNTMLLSLMDTLAAVRNAMTWGRLAANPGPPAPDHHSHAEHAAIVAAIEERDVSGAREAMRVHLEAVERNVLRRVASS
ncbi:MAG TPA: FCD domain-containing protein [Xanthobacteraceae bacterium]|nr:FCD domain-containing protein [Xanthobacteraceae bacterium]